MKTYPTVHELIHALEQIEEAYGEGEEIEEIEIDEASNGKPAKVTVYTNGAVFPIKIEGWE